MTSVQYVTRPTKKTTKRGEINSQVSAEINAIENILLTTLFSGISRTFESLRTHRFVNNDTSLKRLAA